MRKIKVSVIGTGYRGPLGITKKVLPIEKEQPPAKELTSLVDCVLLEKEPLVTGVVARQALEVALAIRDQIWKKRRKS